MIKVLAMLASLVLPASAGTISLYSIDSRNPVIYELDPVNGSTIKSAVITTGDDFTPEGGTGLAADPDNGQLYAVLKVDTPIGRAGGGGIRALATLNPVSGAADILGFLDEKLSALAFDAAGTLYGVSGDGATTSESLFEVDPLNGDLTFIRALGMGDDGEALAYNPMDGALYHASGHGGECAGPDAGVCFERIEIGGGFPTTAIDIDGSILQEEETMALAWAGSHFLWAQDHDTIQPFYRVLPDGTATLIGEINGHQSKGLAFAAPISSPTRRMSWGTVKDTFK